jgi:hypothetical protein
METLEHPEDALPVDFVEELLSRREAAKYLLSIGVRRRASTLAKLASIGGGPPCAHQGRSVLYSKILLHNWGMRQLSDLRRRPRTKSLGGSDAS